MSRLLCVLGLHRWVYWPTFKRDDHGQAIMGVARNCDRCGLHDWWEAEDSRWWHPQI